jgi:hypothetical protein
VSPITAKAWSIEVPLLKTRPYSIEMLIDGRAPRAGEIMKNLNLAKRARTINIVLMTPLSPRDTCAAAPLRRSY